MKNQRRITTSVGIVIIIAAAIILFGGVFAYQYILKSQIPNPNDQPNPNVQTAGPALSEVEGWKTYTNSQYGFEIKYPSDWIYDFDFRSHVNDGNGSAYFCPPELQNQTGNGFNPKEKGCMAQNTIGGSVFTLAPIELSQCDMHSAKDLEKCTSPNLGIDKDKNYGYSLNLFDSRYQTVFNQMLSTFKFTK